MRCNKRDFCYIFVAVTGSQSPRAHLGGGGITNPVTPKGHHITAVMVSEQGSLTEPNTLQVVLILRVFILLDWFTVKTIGFSLSIEKTDVVIHFLKV